MCATQIVCSNKCTRTYGPYVRVVRIGLNKMVQFFFIHVVVIVSYRMNWMEDEREAQLQL